MLVNSKNNPCAVELCFQKSTEWTESTYIAILALEGLSIRILKAPMLYKQAYMLDIFQFKNKPSYISKLDFPVSHFTSNEYSSTIHNMCPKAYLQKDSSWK